MNTGIVRKIQNRHGTALTGLLDALARARPHRPAPGEPPPVRPLGLPRLGPLASVESRGTDLTIVTEWVEAGWFTQEAGPCGTCVSISIAGHNRNTGIRAPLPLAECDAWMTAIMDDAWLHHVYRCTKPARRADHVDSVSYMLFLNEEYSPTLKPVGPALSKHVPLNNNLLKGDHSDGAPFSVGH